MANPPSSAAEALADGFEPVDDYHAFVEQHGRSVEDLFGMTLGDGVVRCSDPANNGLRCKHEITKDGIEVIGFCENRFCKTYSKRRK